jgi:putative ABC transport system permease protein
MWTFFKIAWRDLWRNKLRSGLTLAAITFGTALTLFTMAWARGGHQQMIEAAIGLFPGHLQVHRAGYQEERSLIRSMPLSKEVVDYLEGSPLVSGYSPRLCTDALLQSGGNLAGAQVCGVFPEKEVKTSKLARTFFPELQKLPRGTKPFRRYQGQFLSQNGMEEAVIGEDLARNLQVEVGDELSIISQDFYGSIAAGNFRVKGIFKVGSPDLDGMLMLANISELADLLYMPGHVTELAVMLKDANAFPRIEEELYHLHAEDKGPWSLERLGEEDLWLAQPLRPNLEPDSYLQLADQEITGKALERIPGILGYSGRSKARLLLETLNLDVLGVDPEREEKTSRLLSRLGGATSSGEKFSGDDWILLEAHLAERLGLKQGKEIQVSGRNYLGEEFELRLKLAGVFQGLESDPDAYVSLGMLQEKQRLGGNVHQILIRLRPGLPKDRAEKLISSRLNYEVIPWQELMPDLVQFVLIDNAGAVLWLLILLVVIAFVVLLTILMSVLERAREFGIMKAIGTRPVEIFRIILMESVLLGTLGGITGLVLGLIPSLYFTRVPVDLSSYAESLEEFGVEPYMYARLEPRMILATLAIILFITLVMTVFPAIRAARTSPVQVLRLQ